MIVLLTLIYLACVVVAFRVIKLKVNPVSIAVSVLVGVLMLGGVVTVWKQASPMTGQMTLRKPVLRINPNVREFVSQVHVKSNEVVHQGQPLFEMVPERFQYAEAQARAGLAAARLKVSQLESSVAAAEASVKKADADTGVARAQIKTAKKLKRSSPGAVSKLRISSAESAYLAAQANYNASNAALMEARSSLDAARHAVEDAEAKLRTAEYNLANIVYRSPVDGRVVNFQVREGTPVARWQFTAVGTIIDHSDTAVLAIYPQNLIRHVAKGDVVEIAFRRHPGTIATGKVDTVIKYTGEGQFAASDKIPVIATVGAKGFLAVRIHLDDEKLAKELPLGASGTTAIYSGFGKPFHVISKIALRMKGWLYYLPI